MAQVRQSFRPISPNHSSIRPLPDTVRSRLSPLPGELQQSSYAKSPLRAVHPEHSSVVPPPPPRLGQTTLNSHHDYAKYDPLTGLIIQASTNPQQNSFHEPYLPSSTSNKQQQQQQQPPPIPPRSLENLHSLRLHHHLDSPSRLARHLNETEEFLELPALDDDDGLPVVSLDSRTLPVFARFPFDVTFLPQPMETNVEDNIHRLRLRLIDSDFQQQRRSIDEPLRRTHEQVSLPSSRSRDPSMYPVRPPTNTMMYHRVPTRSLSRQPSYGTLPNGITGRPGVYPRYSRGRMGMDYDQQAAFENERDFEIRQIPETFYSSRLTHQPIALPTHSYDPRLYTSSSDILDRQYTSSNMDDLIDSMARRHLATRRFDVPVEQPRYGSRTYASQYESAVIPRQASFLNAQRHDDVFLINTTAPTQIDPNFHRTYSTRRSQLDQPYGSSIDLDTTNFDQRIRRNSYSKLPPIAANFDRSTNLSNSALYRAKQSENAHRHDQQGVPSIPMNLPDHVEHFIELPSDIYLSSRTGDHHNMHVDPI